MKTFAAWLTFTCFGLLNLGVGNVGTALTMVILGVVCSLLTLIVDSVLDNTNDKEIDR